MHLRSRTVRNPPSPKLLALSSSPHHPNNQPPTPSGSSGNLIATSGNNVPIIPVQSPTLDGEQPKRYSQVSEHTLITEHIPIRKAATINIIPSPSISLSPISVPIKHLSTRVHRSIASSTAKKNRWRRNRTMKWQEDDWPCETDATEQQVEQINQETRRSSKRQGSEATQGRRASSKSKTEKSEVGDDDENYENDENNEEEGDRDDEDREGDREEDREDEEEYGEDPVMRKFREKRDARLTPMQRKFFYFFEEPTSFWAKTFSIISNFFIIVNIMMICLESWPTFVANQDYYYYHFWLPIESLVNAVFTIEYLGRLYAAEKKGKFVTNFMNIIDLISILPFYVEIAFPGQSSNVLRFFRILRLFRIVRILQFSKYSVGINITAKVIRSSTEQFIMVSIYILVILLISSALMYYIERGQFDYKTGLWMRWDDEAEQFEPSPYQSIPHGFYWSIVTLTTTGYGDIVPKTAPGKIIAGITMLCGILTIALPTSIIGSNFLNEWQQYRRLKFQQRLQKSQRRARQEYGPDALLGKKLQMKYLRVQNQAMLETLAEVQEMISVINPPKYYQHFKRAELALAHAKEKIHTLEQENARLQRMNANLQKFNTSNFFPSFRRDTTDSNMHGKDTGGYGIMHGNDHGGGNSVFNSLSVKFRRTNTFDSNNGVPKTPTQYTDNGMNNIDEGNSSDIDSPNSGLKGWISKMKAGKHSGGGSSIPVTRASSADLTYGGSYVYGSSRSKNHDPLRPHSRLSLSLSPSKNSPESHVIDSDIDQGPSSPSNRWSLHKSLSLFSRNRWRSQSVSSARTSPEREMEEGRVRSITTNMISEPRDLRNLFSFVDDNNDSNDSNDNNDNDQEESADSLRRRESLSGDISGASSRSSPRPPATRHSYDEEDISSFPMAIQTMPTSADELRNLLGDDGYKQYMSSRPTSNIGTGSVGSKALLDIWKPEPPKLSLPPLLPQPTEMKSSRNSGEVKIEIDTNPFGDDDETDDFQDLPEGHPLSRPSSRHDDQGAEMSSVGDRNSRLQGKKRPALPTVKAGGTLYGEEADNETGFRFQSMGSE